MAVLFLFQWPAVAKDLFFLIITSTRSKHPQKHMIFNAWLSHISPRDNRTAQPVNLLWVIHYKAAHLLFFTFHWHTHTVLFLATLNNFIHLWTPDMPFYTYRLGLSICVTLFVLETWYRLKVWKTESLDWQDFTGKVYLDTLCSIIQIILLNVSGSFQGCHPGLTLNFIQWSTF